MTPSTSKKRSLIKDLEKIADDAKSFEVAVPKVVDKLHGAFSHFDWTGVYLVEADELAVMYYKGAKTPHERIKIGDGVCSMAVLRKETVIINDVGKEPRYLACSAETKAEIVVPVFAEGRVVGEIDVDSHTLNAFNKEDREVLEHAAALLGTLYTVRKNS